MKAGRAILPLLCLAMTGCDILDPGGGQRDEVEDNRQRWESVRPAAYAFVLERHCFCTPEARGPVRILVDGTVRLQTTYTESGEEVASDLAPFFPTVEGLFNVLLDALDRDAHQVTVTYDEDTGIPVDIWIDYEEFAADEEVGFHVTLPIDDDPYGI